MTAPISAISSGSVGALTPLSFEDPSRAQGAGTDSFANALSGAVDGLQQLQSTSNQLAVRAVTGDLQDIHQATIAAARAAVTLDVVVAVRDRGVAAFNDIMRMQA